MIGYLPFFVVSFWVFDMKSLTRKLTVVGAIFAFDIVCLVVFGAILGWI